MAGNRKRTPGKRGKNGSSDDANGADSNDRIEYVSISQETRRRYLNYAMSVVTSRALPDVRDGLKPVQRRIMYVMYHGLHLTADSRRRKSMKVCGDTTGDFHPHGEGAVYETLVRMAQDFAAPSSMDRAISVRYSDCLTRPLDIPKSN